eukprot:COSAG02_NODE_8131_length_2695_cov_20.340909_2_plen_167_part_00
MCEGPPRVTGYRQPCRSRSSYSAARARAALLVRRLLFGQTCHATSQVHPSCSTEIIADSASKVGVDEDQVAVRACVPAYLWEQPTRVADCFCAIIVKHRPSWAVVPMVNLDRDLTMAVCPGGSLDDSRYGAVGVQASSGLKQRASDIRQGKGVGSSLHMQHHQIQL